MTWSPRTKNSDDKGCDDDSDDAEGSQPEPIKSVKEFNGLCSNLEMASTGVPTVGHTTYMKAVRLRFNCHVSVV